MMSQTAGNAARRPSIFWRGSLAIVLTGIASSFLFVPGLAFVAWLDGWDRSLAAQVSFVRDIGLFGILFALPCALVIGLGVEVPKARRVLDRHQANPLLAQAALSVTAGMALLLVPYLLSLAADQRTSSSPDALDELLGFAAAGAIGGLCSAFFWWALVIRPAQAREAGAPVEP